MAAPGCGCRGCDRGVETYGVEVYRAPALARRVDQIARQGRVCDLTAETLRILQCGVISRGVVCGDGDAPVGCGGGVERSVTRLGNLIFASCGQIVTVRLVASRCYRTEIETSVARPQIAQRDVCRTGYLPRRELFVYRADPHTLVAGGYVVEALRGVVPRQRVYLLSEWHGALTLAAVGRAVVYGVDAVWAVSHPCQATHAVGRGVEYVAARGLGAAQRARTRRAAAQRIQIEIADARVDLLVEHLAAAVFGPPETVRGGVVCGSCRYVARIADVVFDARAGVERDEMRRAVEVLLDEQQAPPVYPYGVGICGVAGDGGCREQLRRRLHGRQRVPVVGQRAEGAAEEVERGEAEEFLHRKPRRHDHPRMPRAVGGDVVADDASGNLVAAGHHLISQLVVVGDEVAVGAAEELVDVSVFGYYVAHGAELECESRLQGPAERRGLGFGHGGVALDHPQRHEEQAYG